MRFEFSHYPLTPSHHFFARSDTLGRAARPNEGLAIHRRSLAVDCSVTLLSLINLRVAIRRNGEMIIVAARLARPPSACLTSLTPPAPAARLNNKAVPANPS